MAEASNGGWFRVAMAGSISIRPTAFFKFTVSEQSGLVIKNRCASASSTEIILPCAPKFQTYRPVSQLIE